MSDAFTILSRFASGDPAAVADAQALFRRGWWSSSNEPSDLDWMGLDSETAAEIERAAAEFNQMYSEARAVAEMGAEG